MIEAIIINLDGSKFIKVKELSNGKWELIGALLDEWAARKIILDFDPKHNVNKKAEIGITWNGYGLSPYFSECNQGGFTPSKDIIISNDLVNWFKEYN